jgi:phage terminase large subunit
VHQESDANSSTIEPPVPINGPSLVLDKNTAFSELYYKKARYKVYWGGRGAAKSWAFAEALIRLTAALPLRVLCVREFQNSMKDSSIKILADTIVRLGLSSWFVVTADSIKSRVGAEFIFKGCHNNTNGIRSTEGIDILWAEEAHSISELSWRVLLPTIRKEGSEIWISFNMDDEADATYRRFVATPRSDSIIHKVNYDSNPYLSAVLRQEMEDDKASDYQLYEHIWLGMARKVSNAIILSGKYRVAEFDEDMWKATSRLRFGADFGFAQDPNTLIRSFIMEGKNPDTNRATKTLYISGEAWGNKVDLDDMPDFYDTVAGARDWPIKADAARPETISHLRRKGFNISAAAKWDGSVKDGIAHLRGYNEIVIAPSCPKTAAEAHAWRYKVDPKIVDAQGQPQVLPIVVDKHNHCWDGIRYSLDGEIQRTGSIGMWERLGKDVPQQ